MWLILIAFILFLFLFLQYKTLPYIVEMLLLPARPKLLNTAQAHAIGVWCLGKEENN